MDVAAAKPDYVDESARTDGSPHASMAGKGAQAHGKDARRQYTRQDRVAVIVAIVAREAGVDPRAVHGQTRAIPVVRARLAARWLARLYCPELSAVKLGKLIADADHTTVLHSIQRVRGLLSDRDHPVSAMIARCDSLVADALVDLDAAGVIEVDPKKPEPAPEPKRAPPAKLPNGYVREDGAIIMHPWAV